jgi:hypothetical protein
MDRVRGACGVMQGFARKALPPERKARGVPTPIAAVVMAAGIAAWSEKRLPSALLQPTGVRCHWLQPP